MNAKHIISIRDLSPADCGEIFQVTAEMKRSPETFRGALAGKTLGMLFRKPSPGVGVAFQVGMYQLGGLGLVLGAADVGPAADENPLDTARVLSSFVDAIVARVDAHADVVELARHATVPVINAASDLLSPCQVLADYFSLAERGDQRGHKLAYVGDGNNTCHSLLYGANKVGMDIAIATPKGYEPKPIIVKSAVREAKAPGVNVTITRDPEAAVEGADAVYTDMWTPAGLEAEAEKRTGAFQAYQVNAALLARAKPDAVFMHCLPVRRDQEVTSEVLDGAQSIVADQTSNRLHVQKAILYLLLQT
jgi:ornithine carbamoyltransferase